MYTPSLRRHVRILRIDNTALSQVCGDKYPPPPPPSFPPAGLLGALSRKEAAHVIHPHTRALPASPRNRQSSRPRVLVHVFCQY